MRRDNHHVKSHKRCGSLADMYGGVGSWQGRNPSDNDFGIVAVSLSRGRRASASLEFAIVAVPFFSFLFAIMGAGLDGFFQLTLDDAVRNAARQLQIDSSASASGAGFAASVCSEFGLIAPACRSQLSYNVQSSSPSAGFASITPAALTSSGFYPNTFMTGAAFADNVNVLVQVALPLPFRWPFFSTLMTGTGTPSIVATTSIRAEPF